ncbi:HesB/YadR/YfhF family protein [Furfurilactobacillus cerevisiae]|uniref:HesB/YadR/YfhF family protein n=1 Tax=Furfurilactobacillus rossiae TaxID=231049 RepID=UPI003B97E3D9
MQITVTDAASKWFQDEVGLKPGDGMKFYGKVYGKTPIHDGFSMAMVPDKDPDRPVGETEKDGIKYFVNYGDAWLFAGYDFVIDFDKKNDEPKYEYVAQEHDSRLQ